MKALFLLPLVALLPVSEPKAEPKPFEKEVLVAAAKYKEWWRVDDELRWAQQLCAPPPTVNKNPGVARMSASGDGDTHGKKLYSVFASSAEKYKSFKTDAGLVIVKQSWTSEEITDEKAKPAKGAIDPKLVDNAERFYPYAWHGDKVYKATKQADLFLMLKLEPKTEGTDEGWVYATTTPNGKTVTGSGKIESCMKCHQESKHDRLFGLPERKEAGK